MPRSRWKTTQFLISPFSILTALFIRLRVADTTNGSSESEMATPTPSLVPASKPPPGVTSNFVDPASLAYRSNIAIGLSVGLTTTFFFLRAFVRIWIKRTWILEDCRWRDKKTCVCANLHRRACFYFLGKDLVPSLVNLSKLMGLHPLRQERYHTVELWAQLWLTMEENISGILLCHKPTRQLMSVPADLMVPTLMASKVVQCRLNRVRSDDLRDKTCDTCFVPKNVLP